MTRETTSFATTNTNHRTTGPERPNPERLRGSRVLVTGARGFIGHHLVRRLIADGVSVHATTRADLRPQSGVHWWRVDLSDPERTTEVIRRVQPDVIVHLASRAEGTRSWELVVPMINSNLLSAVNLLTAAATVPGCRVVLAGSVEEHTDPASGLGTRSPYAASKVAATAFATHFRDLSDVPLGAPVSIRDALSLIAGAVGSAAAPAFGALPDRPGERDRVADPDPRRRYLGWSAGTDLLTGIARAVAGDRERGTASALPVGRHG